MSGEYDDIINLPHHVSECRTKMSLSDRAAQFAPFSALTGYDETVRETERRTDKKVVLDEYEIERIDRVLRYIAQNIEKHVCVSVTYFIADKRKSGGEYREVRETVDKIDDYKRLLVLSNGINIPIEDIYSLTVERE